jgi:hypothetical protein
VRKGERKEKFLFVQQRMDREGRESERREGGQKVEK